jgi:hypothetical protein
MVKICVLVEHACSKFELKFASYSTSYSMPLVNRKIV